jgi:hypothetical protein
VTDIDLTGDIPLAINGAASLGSPIAVAYVDADGRPSVSLRGSLQVLNESQLALWSRKRQGGLVDAIAARPDISLLYYGPTTPGALFLAIRGRARVAPEFDDTVYANMIDGERDKDPERLGVAVVIDVESVSGAGPGGAPISQSRAS